MSQDWQDLVDLAALGHWMDQQGLARGTIDEISLIAGGTQNLLLRFRRGQRGFVLRRPPRHPRINNNETMRREARVLAALADTAVPHPRLIAACGDETVLGAAFYLMEPVEGFNASVALPALHAADPAMRRSMGMALVDGAAALGNIDHFAAGLHDLGKAEGFLDRQVARWRQQLEGYREHVGWPGPESIGGIDAIADWLDAHRPASFTPGILHGDYHLANVMFRYDSPQLAAIVDWELCTIGDPLMDLGWLLATWPDAGRPESATVPVRPWLGFPTGEELIERYAQGSRRDLSAINWYAVLACYKLGILLEGTYARACAGKAPRDTGATLHAKALMLFTRALARIEAGAG